jgi:hypothetical protein
LRGLSRNVGEEAKIQIKNAVLDDVPEMLGLKPNVDLKAGQQFSLADLENAKKEGEVKATKRFENRLSQERTFFIQAETQVKQQIMAIQEDIKKMAKSLGELGNEVQIATMQEIVNPGVYHRNFFNILRSLITSLRAKVTESKNWLAANNARAKQKKGFYWAQAKKSGTKFTLSSERYMVTSTG